MTTQENYIERVLLAMRCLNQLVAQEEDTQRIIQRACDELVRTIGYSAAWIVLVEKRGGSIQSAATAGLEIDAAEVSGETPRWIHLAMEAKDCPILLQADTVGFSRGESQGCFDEAVMAGPVHLQGDMQGAIGVTLAENLARYQEEQSLFRELVCELATALNRVESIQRRRSAEQELASVLDSISDAFFVLDDDLVVTYFNTAAEHMLRRSAGEIVGRPLFDAFPEARGSVFERRYREAIRTKTPMSFEVRFDVPPYEDWYDVRVYPRENGISVYFIVTTARKQAEVETKRALSDANHRERETRCLLEASRAVLDCHRFEDAARSVFDICRKATGAVSGYVALVSADGHENEVLFLEAGGMPCDVDPSLPMPIRGLRAESYASGAVVYENDFMHSEWVRFMPPGHVEMQNVLFAPLRVEGQVVGVIGLANKPTDFTEDDAKITGALADLTAIALRRARAEERHSRSEAMLKRTERIAHVGSWEWDSASDSVTWSDELFRIFGRDPAEGAPSFAMHNELYTPSDFERLKKAVGQALEDGTPYALELSARRADGEIRHCIARGYRETTAGDKSPRLYGSFQDITDQKRAERAYSTFCQMATEMICVADLDTATFLRINPAFEHILGYSESELLRKPFLEFVHPDDVQPTLDVIEEILKRGAKIISFENRYRCKDGSYRWLDWNSYPVPGEGVTYAIAHDVTDRKNAEIERERLEVQLRQAQKLEAVGRLAGGVAHDFNNMLQTIIGYTDMLLADEAFPAGYRDEVGQIHSAACRSADLTRQLLAFSRQQTIAPKVLDLNLTISGMLTMLRRMVGEHIRLTWEPAADLWPVRIDPTQLDQVLVNLILNARDAIADGGEVIIRTERVQVDWECSQRHQGTTPGPFVRMSFVDDGEGMDDRTLSRIFEPFFSTKPKEKGTGLGMATVYGIVKQNMGFLEVRSQPGRGTTVEVYLPGAVDAKVHVREPTSPTVTEPGCETVLLVEDEPALLRLNAMMLRSLGYVVLAAEGPEQAIELAKENVGQIQLLLTDVVMPGMSGRDLWTVLRQSQPSLPCVFMSGYTANVIAQKGVLEEGMHYLQKPFSVEALAAKLRGALKA